MDFRSRRQFAVIVVVLLIVLIPLGFFIYRSLPEPSCFDNKKNRGEEEIDCGGICIPCELKHPKEITVLWARFVPTREGFYDLAAEIRNQNIKLGAVELPYEFRLFDDRGVLIGTRTGKTFLFSGETAHVVETNIVTKRTPQTVSFRAHDVRWRFTDALPPDIVIGAKHLRVSSERGETILTASLINRSLSDFSNVHVVVFLLDDAENIIAASAIVEPYLASGETRQVFFSWPRLLPDDARIVIEPRMNTLAP